MKHIGLLLLVILACSSCIGYAPIPGDDVKQRYQASTERLEARKAKLEGVSLADKEKHFDKFITEKLQRPDWMLIGKAQVNGNLGHIEYSALLLASYSLRYSLAPSDELYAKIHNLVDQLIFMDKINGMDGYVAKLLISYGPDNVRFDEGSETRSNAYAHLFMGYALCYKLCPDMRPKIKEHCTLIMDYFVKNDFKIIDHKGEEVKHSDLRDNSLSRQLDALVILETGLSIIDKEDTRQALAKQLKEWEDYKTPRFLELDLWVYRVPTHSSDYLIMMRLYILNLVNPDDKDYRKLLKRHYEIQQREHNPFFNAIYASVFGTGDVDLAKHKYYMDSFPTDLSRWETINSRNKDIKRKFIAPIIKNKAVAEAKEPLPIYKRPTNGIEWKRNPYRMDGNFGSNDGNVIYSGVDYLLAYWMSK
jgi:hypothetical protein